MRRPKRLPAKKPTLKEALKLSEKDLNDKFLRRTQKLWDEQYFDKTFTRESNGTCFVDAKVSHIGEHIAKLLKQVHRLSQDQENENYLQIVTNESVGDAAIYRTQLANTLAYNLHKNLDYAETSSGDLQEAKDLLIDSLPQHYTEQQEHRYRDAELRADVRNNSIPALHMAHLILANYCEIEDPQRAHLERLAQAKNINGIS